MKRTLRIITIIFVTSFALLTGCSEKKVFESDEELLSFLDRTCWERDTTRWFIQNNTVYLYNSDSHKNLEYSIEDAIKGTIKIGSVEYQVLKGKEIIRQVAHKDYKLVKVNIDDSLFDETINMYEANALKNDREEAHAKSEQERQKKLEGKSEKELEKI